MFKVLVKDDKGNEVDTSPDSFSMICGVNKIEAVLARDIWVEAKDLNSGKMLLLPLKGLAKNQSLPAKGTKTLVSLKQVNPGKKTDELLFDTFREVFYSDSTQNKKLIL